MNKVKVTTPRKAQQTCSQDKDDIKFDEMLPLNAKTKPIIRLKDIHTTYIHPQTINKI